MGLSKSTSACRGVAGELRHALDSGEPTRERHLQRRPA